LFVAVLVNYIDRNNLSVAAVPVMDEFGFSPSEAGALMAAFFWTYTLMQIPSGWAADRFGLRWTYGIAFLVWSLSSAAIGLARSFGQIFGLRLILGLGQAAAQPVSLTYIRTNFADREQGLPTGLYISGMMIGPAAGGFLGGVLLERLGWRDMFVLTGLVPCVWLLPWFWLAPRGRTKTRAADPPSASKVPLRKLFANPVVWGITITAFFYSYFWYFCLSWLPSYLVMERGLSFLEMGVYTALPFIAMSIVSPSAGRLADHWIGRTGRPVFVRKVFVITGFLLGSSTLALIWVESSQVALALLIFALAGIGLTSANYWALTQAISPQSFIGRAVGYQNTISNLAGICAPMLTGYLLEESGSFNSAILFAAASLWLAAASYALLVRESWAGEIKVLLAGPPPQG
jgi:MFS family permease